MTQFIAGVARAAILVDLVICIYSGRKMDRRTQAEVVAAKGANSKRAASVYKSLFAECAALDAISKFQGRVRQEHYRLTQPWNDFGSRLLPTALLLEYKTEMSLREAEFNVLVDTFLITYDTLVAAAAFQLGTLFDRSEYPSRDEVARKFSMTVQISPLPTAGDFRLDIESEVQQELADQYEARATKQLAASTQDSWDRLHAALCKLSERLVVDDDGKKRVFHDTLVTGAMDMCELLTHMNILRDPALEKARSQLEAALTGVTPKELREEDGTRVLTKQKVDAILSAFDWGDENGDGEDTTS